MYYLHVIIVNTCKHHNALGSPQNHRTAEIISLISYGGEKSVFSDAVWVPPKALPAERLRSVELEVKE